MEKADGAFLTIGELAQELGVGQHVLRYWETRFPQLKPLQRSGNRRYYRPQDVAIARQIHRLLNVEGFTMKGALKALGMRGGPGDVSSPPPASASAPPSQPVPAPPPAEFARAAGDDRAADDRAADGLLDRLQAIRGELAAALDPRHR